MSKHRTHTTGWNRLLSGVLCLALVLGLLPAGLVLPAQAAGSEHWATPYGEQLIEWGVMTELRLSDTITRAEFVTMCNRAFGFKKLGGMPFTDVPSSAWYAQDIAIAYNAGYFQGTSNTTAAPKSPLTREQAAVLIARILMLRETVGESLGFTDSHSLHEWSRGLIGAAAAEGMITGYDDGSFRPFNNITRGEVAAMLVRVLGNPVSTAGNYDKLNGGDVYGSVTISSSNVTLRNTVIQGNLYITGGIDLGNVLLENVTVLGRIVVSGGGESNAAQSSVILRNVTASELVVDSIIDQFVTISAYGVTDIANTYVRSDAYLADNCTAEYGLRYIELDGKPGTELQLAGTIKEVVNLTPNSLLQLVKGTAEMINIDEYATNSRLVVGTDTRVDVVNLDVATRITGDGNGEGDIIQLNIFAAGSEVDILPAQVGIRPGITATVNGEVVNSSAADELSSEPRLMAGYPAADKFTLDPQTELFQANGLYLGNKPGTIYWAVSALADGSVSVEHLINNPPYGGNIYEGNSGSFSSDSRQVYVQPISKLEPDGSYYISAVLVDDRGIRSPRKVVSFTAPDNTTPAFMEGYPYMSKITCENAQVTAMANKSCQLYWVLLKAGATAPTAQSFKSGSFGGNYGYGTKAVVKNVPVSITTNTVPRLQENTDYDLYLWLCDLDGPKSSDVIKVQTSTNAKDPSFRTPDETAPVVSNVMQTNYNLADAVEFSFTANEADVTLYWAVVAQSNESWIKPTDDMSSLSTRLKVESGTGSLVHNEKKAPTANLATEVKAADFRNALKYSTDLPTHNFKLYYVARDAAGNYSDVKYIIIHTADNDPPTVTLSFSDALYNTDADKAAGRKPQPQSTSSLILTFSEQVKGEDPETGSTDTFVELYNKVATATGTAKATWKKQLGDALAKHIELYYLPNGWDDVIRTGKKLNSTDKSKDYGWVDFSNAVVELQKDGTVKLTLPGSGDGQAVKLGGGLEYGFRFTNVIDDSYTGNLLVLKDSSGKVISPKGADTIDLDTFTTVYAQVWLSEDETGISSFKGKDKDGKEIDVSLDMVVKVDPQSVGNTNETDCWDMIIWNDSNASVTSVTIVIYRSDDDGKTWTAVTPEDEDDQVSITSTLAISLNKSKKDDADRYQTVTKGLKEWIDKPFMYGIHFTKIGSETDPDAWSSKIALRFSLVAGSQNHVKAINDGIVSENFTNLVETLGYLSEISCVRVRTTTGTTTETQLTVEKQFTDKRAPSFEPDSPTFTATASSISMDVQMNRTGTLYYLVIPAADLYPTYKGNSDTVRVSADNDGRGIKDGVIPESGANTTTDVDNYFTSNTAKNTDGKTYIPLSGKDRDDNYKHIFFAPQTPGEKGGVYSKPLYDEIFVGTYAKDAENTVAGSIAYTRTSKQTFPLDGGTGKGNLKPNTWYYVYLVLRSESGTFDEAVQVYRVKTLDATPPGITIVREGTTAVTMTVNDQNDINTLYDNPMLSYALVRKDQLDKTMFGKYYIWSKDMTDENGKVKEEYGPFDSAEAARKPKDEDEEKEKAAKSDASASTVPAGDIMTVWAAMGTQISGTGKSYFDEYAGKELKNNAMRFITRATIDGSVAGYFGPRNENEWATSDASAKRDEFTSRMIKGYKYIVLACARHFYGDQNEGVDYGFAAADGLEVEDKIPPTIDSPKISEDEKDPNKGTARLEASDISLTVTNKNGEPRSDWQFAKLENYATFLFSGTITITFSKEIYTLHNGALKQIVGQNVTSLNGDMVSIGSLVNILEPAKGSDKTDSKDLRAGITSITSADGKTFLINFQNIPSSGSRLLSLNHILNVSGYDAGKTLTVTVRPLATLADTDNAFGATGTIWNPSVVVSWQ